MAKVLISDKLSPKAVSVFEQRGVEVDVRVGLSPDELAGIIGDYDGLAIRSATKVTKEILAAAKNMKVVGRAGIGVDNVDIAAATQNGVVVMNTPFGNSVTTAEHAIAMMMSLARKIPAANASTHAGKWEKSAFMGTEICGKTLGLIGCGNIGGIVADRALGLKMKVVAYDPYLAQEKAEEMGLKKIDSLDELLAIADFITLHTPLNDSTKNILNKESLAKTKKGAMIINCARGGLIDEVALKDAIDDGQIAGAALDVFEVEPAKENALFGLANVVCTPHLGASTSEAQENVAVQVAQQMSDYLLEGSVTNAINMPSLSAADAGKLEPYLHLAGQLGGFAGQLTENGLKEINIEYHGKASELNTKPLTSNIVYSVLSPLIAQVNIVNALLVAKERGIKISETKANNPDSDYPLIVRVTVKTDSRSRTIAGTLFGGKFSRIVEVHGIRLEATLGKYMLYVNNEDKPGLIGELGGLLGRNNINIANFHLGRHAEHDGEALALVEIDSEISADIIAQIDALATVKQAKLIRFG